MLKRNLYRTFCIQFIVVHRFGTRCLSALRNWKCHDVHFDKHNWPGLLYNFNRNGLEDLHQNKKMEAKKVA